MLPLVTKALHLAFMVTWFAGLFYLPRLFIYHAEADSLALRDQFGLMEKRLFAIMTIGAGLTLFFGIWTLSTAAYAPTIGRGWFQIKLVLLLGLIIHHLLCWRWIQRLRAGYQPENTKWLRFFNEIPAIYLFAIVLLAVLKPF